jgi:hypothetical protein
VAASAETRTPNFPLSGHRFWYLLNCERATLIDKMDCQWATTTAIAVYGAGPATFHAVAARNAAPDLFRTLKVESSGISFEDKAGGPFDSC